MEGGHGHLCVLYNLPLHTQKWAGGSFIISMQPIAVTFRVIPPMTFELCHMAACYYKVRRELKPVAQSDTPLLSHTACPGLLLDRGTLPSLHIRLSLSFWSSDEDQRSKRLEFMAHGRDTVQLFFCPPCPHLIFFLF